MNQCGIPGRVTGRVQGRERIKPGAHGVVSKGLGDLGEAVASANAALSPGLSSMMVPQKRTCAA
jgi:hypothetical protein